MMRIFHGNEVVTESMHFCHRDNFWRMIISHHHVPDRFRHQFKQHPVIQVVEVV